MDAGAVIILNKDTQHNIAKPFRELLGALMYLSCCTRPDISFAVSALARVGSNPSESDWKAAKRVMRYLKGTASLGIMFTQRNGYLEGYSDADWGGDKTSRKSTTGFVFKFANGPVSWKSRLQPTVALSTSEDEYMALSDCTRGTVFAEIDDRSICEGV